MDRLQIENYIKGLLAKELSIDPSTITKESTFYDLGLDSVNSIFLIHEIEEEYTIEIDPISIYDNPSLMLFSEYIKRLVDESS